MESAPTKRNQVRPPPVGADSISARKCPRIIHRSSIVEQSDFSSAKPLSPRGIAAVAYATNRPPACLLNAAGQAKSVKILGIDQIPEGSDIQCMKSIFFPTMFAKGILKP